MTVLGQGTALTINKFTRLAYCKLTNEKNLVSDNEKYPRNFLEFLCAHSRRKLKRFEITKGTWSKFVHICWQGLNILLKMNMSFVVSKTEFSVIGFRSIERERLYFFLFSLVRK